MLTWRRFGKGGRNDVRKVRRGGGEKRRKCTKIGDHSDGYSKYYHPLSFPRKIFRDYLQI